MVDTPLVMRGISAGIRTIEDDIERAVRSDSQVLLTGEHGVGKTLVARLIHLHSPRAAGPLMMVSCAGLSSAALETQLFGSVTTDSGCERDDAQGLLAAADGATIVIDNVEEMNLRTQGLLFRFLETGELPRVGSDRRGRQLDVRVITASHWSLLESIADQAFREDLYYRLNVVHIKIPPLRARREDIPVLMHYFLRMFARAHQRDGRQLTDAAVAALMAYSWPDNVRELRDVAQQLVLQGDGWIDADALPAAVTRADPRPVRSRRATA
jgi:DNA-binding NtrC family response regulator